MQLGDQTQAGINGLPWTVAKDCSCCSDCVPIYLRILLLAGRQVMRCSSYATDGRRESFSMPLTPALFSTPTRTLNASFSSPLSKFSHHVTINLYAYSMHGIIRVYCWRRAACSVTVLHLQVDWELLSLHVTKVSSQFQSRLPGCMADQLWETEQHRVWQRHCSTPNHYWSDIAD